MDDSIDATAPTADDRLDGWKEISTFLGRGVRTAQRWERDLALPIRRLETKGAEVVYGFRGEIDEWRRSRDPGRSAVLAEGSSDGLDEESVSTESIEAEASVPIVVIPTAATPSWRSRHTTIAVSILVLATLSVILWPARTPVISSGFSPATAAGQPARWHIEGRTLQVHDAQMRLLWQHVFEFPIDQGVYDAGLPLDGQSPPGALADLDGDGRLEVLVVPWASSPQFRRLYAFRGNGDVIFSTPPTRSASDPESLSAGRFVVARDDGGRQAIWLTVTRGTETSTIIQKLNAEGKAVAEYRDGGDVTFLKPAQLANRRVMLVGSSMADRSAAILTVLDTEQPGVRDTEASHRRHDAPTPIGRVSFPASDVARELSRSPRIDTVEIAGDGSLTVAVLQARVIFPRHHASTQATVLYSLTPDLKVTGTRVSDAYLLAHSELQLLGQLNHRFGTVHEDALPSVP